MVMGGQCSSTEKMDQLIATGLIIREGLETSKWRVLAGTGEDTPSDTYCYSPTSWFQDFEGNSLYAQYSDFTVGDSDSRHTLSVSGYSGTAGDSLSADTSLAQGNRTMMPIVKSVHNCTKVLGGIVFAKSQWSLPSWTTLLLCWWCELVHMEGIQLLPQIHWDKTEEELNISLKTCIVLLVV